MNICRIVFISIVLLLHLHVQAQDVVGSRHTVKPHATCRVGDLVATSKVARAGARVVMMPACLKPHTQRSLPQAGADDKALAELELRDDDAVKGNRYPKFFPKPPINASKTFVIAEQKEVVKNDGYRFALPPDAVGAVSPRQLVACVNNLVRVFNKRTGKIQNHLCCDLMNLVSQKKHKRAGALTFTSPRIVYDRMSKNFFIAGTLTRPNGSSRLMLVVISGPDISKRSTINSFILGNVQGTTLFDYPTLGVDEHAVYVGANAGTIKKGTRAISQAAAFVIDKATLLAKHKLSYTSFVLPHGVDGGAWAPHAVSNVDAQPISGYFVATDLQYVGLLHLLEVADVATNPKLRLHLLRVPTYAPPVSINLGKDDDLTMDALDERLTSAHVRDGRLWTMHTVGVNRYGISADNKQPSRNGCRWYEINVGTAQPSLVQAGIMYKPTPTNRANKASYFIGSLMTNGQGNMVIGCHKAGAKRSVDCAWGGRFHDYGYGKIIRPSRFTSSSAQYRPQPTKQELAAGKRFFGQYSQTCVDPDDDMTLWSVQPYCRKNNQWCLCVQKFNMPPPPKLAWVIPQKIPANKKQVQVKLISFNDHRVDKVATSVYENKEAFFDPGSAAPRHVQVQVNGKVKVRSVTYVSPFELDIVLSTKKAKKGQYNIAVVNPDGQRHVDKGVLTVG